MTDATPEPQQRRNAEPTFVHLPASRGRALTRAIAWAAPTAVFGCTTALLFDQIDFRPTAVAGRLVTYSLAIAALLPAVVTLGCAVKTFQWLFFSLWPGELGVTASPDTLTVRLGTFGHRRYDTAALDVRYPYELPAGEIDDEFDAFLEEAEQRRRLLPRISHAGTAEPLNRTILRFVGMRELDVTERLRPLIEDWRRDRRSASKE